MRNRLSGPAPLPLRKRVVAVPGHRLVAGSRSEGLQGMTCECGSVLPLLPPIEAAARRYDHLEVFDMSSKTEKLVMSGRPFAHAGRSIAEVIWTELDAVYLRLMNGAAEPDDKGRAGGLAYALAVLANPYDVDVEQIRARAHIRWEDGLSPEELARYGAADDED